MKTIMWKNEVWDIEGIRPAKYNPRKISDKQREELKRSIERFGSAEPIVVNSDGTIIGGHQRYRVYLELGRKEVAVAVPSRRLSDKEERELNLRLNRNTGEFDWALLADFGRDELEAAGFDEEEMRINMGLNEAGNADLDPERRNVLEIVPPEYPRLKERAIVHCDTVAQYEAVKAAVDSGAVTAERILAAFKP